MRDEDIRETQEELEEGEGGGWVVGAEFEVEGYALARGGFGETTWMSVSDIDIAEKNECTYVFGFSSG